MIKIKHFLLKFFISLLLIGTLFVTPALAAIMDPNANIELPHNQIIDVRVGMPVEYVFWAIMPNNEAIIANGMPPWLTLAPDTIQFPGRTYFVLKGVVPRGLGLQPIPPAYINTALAPANIYFLQFQVSPGPTTLAVNYGGQTGVTSITVPVNSPAFTLSTLVTNLNGDDTGMTARAQHAGGDPLQLSGANNLTITPGSQPSITTLAFDTNPDVDYLPSPQKLLVVNVVAASPTTAPTTAPTTSPTTVPTASPKPPSQLPRTGDAFPMGSIALLLGAAAVAMLGFGLRLQRGKGN